MLYNAQAYKSCQVYVQIDYKTAIFLNKNNTIQCEYKHMQSPT